MATDLTVFKTITSKEENMGNFFVNNKNVRIKGDVKDSAALLAAAKTAAEGDIFYLESKSTYVVFDGIRMLEMNLDYKTYLEFVAVKTLDEHHNHGYDALAAALLAKLRPRTPYHKASLNAAYGTGTSITKVVFNDPATIVMWSDGTKTVVKCGEHEAYDPEKGMAMAIAKKFLGTSESKGDYYKVFKKWIPKKTAGQEELDVLMLTEHPDATVDIEVAEERAIHGE